MKTKLVIGSLLFTLVFSVKVISAMAPEENDVPDGQLVYIEIDANSGNVMAGKFNEK
jgi:hypothetical protein